MEIIFSPLLLISFITGLLVSWICLSYTFHNFQKKSKKSLQEFELSIREKYESTDILIRQREKESFSLLETKKRELTAIREEIKKKELFIAQTEKKRKNKEKELEERKKELIKKEESLISKYEALSHTTREMAYESLIASIKNEISEEINSMRQHSLQTLQEDLILKSEEALQSAFERLKGVCTKDHVSSVIYLLDNYEQIAPKLIGKEGRNIQTLEMELGVHITCDAQEKSIQIFSHSSRARWIAKHLVEALKEREKITPSIVQEEKKRIEYILSSTSTYLPEVQEKIALYLPEALSLPEAIQEKINQLFFTNSLGQNLFLHSLEVGFFMKKIAQELLLPSHTIGITGLVHDIGKILEKSWGKTHSQAGAHFLQENGLSEECVLAVLSHHGEATKTSNTALILAVADRISGGLLAARKNEINSCKKASHHHTLLTKIEEILLKNKFVSSVWASFRSQEEHFYGSIEIVIILSASGYYEEQSTLIHQFSNELKQYIEKRRLFFTFLETK